MPMRSHRRLYVFRIESTRYIFVPRIELGGKWIILQLGISIFLRRLFISLQLINLRDIFHSTLERAANQYNSHPMQCLLSGLIFLHQLLHRFFYYPKNNKMQMRTLISGEFYCPSADTNKPR